MGGTQRVAKFSKYLPEFGWQPFVITVKPVFYYAQDASLLDELTGIPIFRTGSLDPLRLLQIFKKSAPAAPKVTPKVTSAKSGWKSSRLIKFLNDILGGWLLIPDTKVLWLPFAIFRTARLIRQEQIEMIFTTSPPQSVHLAGLLLKKIFRIKWVADFRDELTGGESQASPTRVHTYINQVMERTVLRNADAIVGISDRLMRNLQIKAGRRLGFTTIRNGFDAADLAHASKFNPPATFTILHCGSLSKVSQPGPFLQAIAELFDAQPELRGKIRMQFVGTDIFGQLPPLIAQYNLAEHIEIIGYVPHQEAVQKLFQAHVLLLLVIKSSPEEIITGKVFEYLASGRPILAIIPPGELAEMITAAHAGTVLDYQNTQQIQQTLLKYYAQFLAGSLPVQADDSVFQFERKYLTGILGTIMQRLIGEGDSLESHMARTSGALS